MFFKILIFIVLILSLVNLYLTINYDWFYGEYINTLVLTLMILIAIWGIFQEYKKNKL